MSNYENETDKLRAHLESLTVKHRNIDKDLETRFHNMDINEEVRRLKTEKLWLKDEIHRVQRKLESLGAYVNGNGR